MVYGDEEIEERRQGLRYLLAGMLGYGVVATAFAGLAIVLVIRRENGILKRLRATPLPPAVYLAAVIASTVLVFALEAVALIVLGAAPVRHAGSRAWASVILSCCSARWRSQRWGSRSRASIRSGEGSSAVVNAIYLPMAFLAGAFCSTHAFPASSR